MHIPDPTPYINTNIFDFPKDPPCTELQHIKRIARVKPELCLNKLLLPYGYLTELKTYSLEITGGLQVFNSNIIQKDIFDWKTATRNFKDWTSTEEFRKLFMIQGGWHDDDLWYLIAVAAWFIPGLFVKQFSYQTKQYVLKQRTHVPLLEWFAHRQVLFYTLPTSDVRLVSLTSTVAWQFLEYRTSIMRFDVRLVSLSGTAVWHYC